MQVIYLPLPVDRTHPFSLAKPVASVPWSQESQGRVEWFCLLAT